jgi:hypothetical protein
MRFRPLLALAPVLLVATGCGPKPINESKTLTLDTQTPASALLVPAQKKAVKLTVEFTSSAGDVSIHVFKDSDIKDDEAMTTVESSKALASGKRGKEGTFTADVPENTATRVVVRQHTAAKTEVTVKVSTAK